MQFSAPMDILIVEPHALSRLGLKQLVTELHAGASINEAENGLQAHQWLQDHRAPDLILADPRSDGLEPTRQLSRYRDLAAHSRLAALLEQPAPVDDLDAMMRAGANACLCKSLPLETLRHGLSEVLMGREHWPAAPRRPGWELTPRQREVLRLIGEGDSNRQIADRLGLTEGTVKLHVTGILKSLGVRNRTQAALLLRQSALETA